MKKITLLLVVLSFLSCGSVAKYNKQITKIHSKAELQEDIDYAYGYLKRNHPDLDTYYSQETIDHKFDSLKKAIKPMNTHDFYYALNEALKPIAQGHTSIIMPFKEYTKKERKARGKRTSFAYDYELKTIANKLYISRQIKGDSALVVGTEIEQINDESVQDLLAKYRKQIISDGYNKTFQPRVTGKRFWAFYAKDKGLIDSVNLQCKLNDSVFNHVLKAKYKKKGDEKIEDIATKKDSVKPNTDQTTKAVNKLAKKALRKKHKLYSYSKKEKVYYRDFKFVGDTINNPIALLKIRGFSDGKYKKCYDEIFSKIDSSKAQHLIIDLRDNFGGSLNEITYLYSYLAKKDIQMIGKAKMTKRTSIFNVGLVNTGVVGKLITLAASPYITYMMLTKVKREKDGNLYFHYKASKKQSPKEKRFKGTIYVLTNGNSFSASAVFSTQLKANKRATFIGEETGGAYNSTVAGMFIYPELPNSKITMRFGLMNIETPYHQNPPGHGVYPDITLLPNATDLKNGIDTELDYTLKLINDNK